MLVLVRARLGARGRDREFTDRNRLTGLIWIALPCERIECEVLICFCEKWRMYKVELSPVVLGATSAPIEARPDFDVCKYPARTQYPNLIR